MRVHSSRFRGPVQHGPVQGRETQIVQVPFDFRRLPAVIQATGTLPWVEPLPVAIAFPPEAAEIPAI